jgi:hypothetical protein
VLGRPAARLLIVAAFLPAGIFGMLTLFAPLAYVEIGSALRLFGCGGYLGWFGLFYSRSMGQFWAYAGNQEDLALLTQTDGTKIVISPCPPEAFLKAVQGTVQARN